MTLEFDYRSLVRSGDAYDEPYERDNGIRCRRLSC